MAPSKYAKLIRSTVLVESTEQETFHGKAKREFTVGAVTVQPGQAFFLVRSKTNPERAYLLVWDDAICAYKCSCGCPAHKDTHTPVVKGWIVEHVVKTNLRTQLVQPTPEVVAKIELVKKQEADRYEVPEDVKRSPVLNGGGQRGASLLSILPSRRTA